MPALPQSNLHLDILMGRDETLEPADLFGGQYILPNRSKTETDATLIGLEAGPSMDIHSDMEKSRKI